MANTKSAKKAIIQSKKKQLHNQSWKSKIKALLRSIKTNASNLDILNIQYKELQSTLDKAAKKKVIHKNKAARIKSRVANKVSKTANATGTDTKPTKSTKSKSKSV